MIAYINLNNYVRDSIRTIISQYHGYLTNYNSIAFDIDCYLSAPLINNVKFFPCKIEDNILTIEYKKDDEFGKKTFNIKEIAEEGYKHEIKRNI